jgi:hypothetical protein
MKIRPIESVPIAGYELKNEDSKWDALYAQARERLEERIKHYDVSMPAFMPAQDILVVYRLPPKEKATMHKGILHIPQVAQEEQIPYSVGVYILAGAEAADVLESHGILPGDFIKFSRFAGDEEAATRVNEAIAQAQTDRMSPVNTERMVKQARDESLERKKLLELQVASIHGSVDLIERLYGDRPSMRMVREVGPRGRKHLILPT